jgi:hypothetical protein
MVEPMSRSIYQNEWASTARMLIALQRDLRTTLFPREVATLIEWGFIKREGQTYRLVAWMGEADQRRVLNRITAILSHATTVMTLAKLATSVAH